MYKKYDFEIYFYLLKPLFLLKKFNESESINTNQRH